ncbi:MAG TPA: ATP synthase F0 subunit B [Candidatus Hydrogenedens sp.]|nr:ATP synthase F0 subunit B [Candidatus Hydrogenedens sp.]HOL21008.1 ATP synthase F0 subunit B [Candidatus Hydrogenedens sp.]HPP58282.1 ATP synthase F0 subunit B [Candidatus Hydrogenedens sp.]
MITINFTIIIELLLFVIFFIVLRKLIWSPLLNTIKHREEFFEKKKREVETYKSKANQLRIDYQKQIEMIQKNYETEIDTIVRNAYNQQRKIIEQEQTRARELLNQYHNELEKYFYINRNSIEPYATELAEKIQQCLASQKKLF